MLTIIIIISSITSSKIQSALTLYTVDEKNIRKHNDKLIRNDLYIDCVHFHLTNIIIYAVQCMSS